MEEVKARFSVETKTLRKSWVADKSPYKGHMQDVHMTAIMANTGATEEEKAVNRTFWQASPSGEIKLGTVNPAAGDWFDIGDIVEVTFRKVGRVFPKPE
jgi:hypothetical protein